MASKSRLFYHEKLFDDVFCLIKSYLIKYHEQSSKVVEFKTPVELDEQFNFRVGEEGTDSKEILSLCDKVLSLSVHTCHPYFYNTLFGDADEIGLLGSFVSVVSNTNVHTYEMAPVYTVMESSILSHIRELVGWEEGDGIFAPGGSISNLYGLLLARFNRFPESRTKGVFGLPKMALFCSEQSHYSVLKTAIIMGVGVDNVIKIPCDERGRMMSSELDLRLSEVVSNGIIPIAVVATVGTTVLGAIDPLEEIAQICAKHKVWLHVDAAVGGSLLFSQKHRPRLAGIEKADSMTWNPHKSIGAPLQCSCFVTKHQTILADCNSVKAGYLFQKDKITYDSSLDSGDKSIQCGRLADVFKLWLMWKHEGMSGVEHRINWSMELSQYLAEKIRLRQRFYLLVEEPDCTNVCFWYIPPCLDDSPVPRLIAGQIEGSERLTKVAPIIKARMVAKGNMLMAYQPLPGGVPNCLRMVIINPRSTKEDMDFVLDEIEALGHDIIV